MEDPNPSVPTFRVPFVRTETPRKFNLGLLFGIFVYWSETFNNSPNLRIKTSSAKQAPDGAPFASGLLSTFILFDAWGCRNPRGG